MRLRSFIKKARIKILKIFKKDINFIYNEPFAIENLQGLKFANKMGEIIDIEFHPQSVVDFGCGTATILEYFERKGIEILGIDGSEANRKYSRINVKNFVLFDIRRKYTVTHKYDLCMCLEVGEHIEEKYSDMLINNLIMSSSTILFGAAPVGQGGTDHCNEKPYVWWIERFKKYNFEFDKNRTDKLRKKLSSIPDIFYWYINNIMVFSEMSLHL
ncbi:MAG: class I SAM-dependent methyltransferase [Candidatus Omnitrophota bacterium]